MTQITKGGILPSVASGEPQRPQPEEPNTNMSTMTFAPHAPIIRRPFVPFGRPVAVPYSPPVEREVPVPAPTPKAVAPVTPVVETDAEYNAALAAFTKQLRSDQKRGSRQRKEKVSEITVTVQPGRKFDRISIAMLHEGDTEPKSDIRYFVNRATGEIFGAKSKLAPNANHYFGRVYHADKWDWSGHYGTNKSDDSVKEIGKYGHFTHYAPLHRFQR